MARLILPATLALLLLAGGCLRAGFEPAGASDREAAVGDSRRDQWAGAADRAAADRGASERAPDGATGVADRLVLHDLTRQSVTLVNDTCAAPLTIDLAPVNAGLTLSILVLPTGAKKDYATCSAGIDLAVRFINASGGTYHWYCEGGGSLSFTASATCPPSGTMSTAGTSCDGPPTVALAPAAGTSFAVVCVDISTPQTLYLGP